MLSKIVRDSVRLFDRIWLGILKYATKDISQIISKDCFVDFIRKKILCFYTELAADIQYTQRI